MKFKWSKAWEPVQEDNFKITCTPYSRSASAAVAYLTFHKLHFYTISYLKDLSSQLIGVIVI